MDPRKEQFREFLAALDAEKIRLEISNRKGQVEKITMDRNQALENFTRLQVARDQGLQVRLTPESPDKHFIIVSGLNELALKTMRADGIVPSIITETNENTYQAVVRISNANSQQAEKIQKTLALRYGNGQSEQITVPGFYADNSDRLPRISRLDLAAPTQGEARLLEKIQERAPEYEKHEQAMRTHVQQRQQDQGQKEQVQNQEAGGQTFDRSRVAALFEQWRSAKAMQDEQKRAQYEQRNKQDQQQFGGSLVDMLAQGLMALARLIFAVPLCALGILPPPQQQQMQQEQTVQADLWQKTSPFTQQELNNTAPCFAQQQQAQQQEQQQQIAQVPAIAPSQDQSQSISM